ncbi:hypothetical protein DFH09DRAFT_1076796 [Mycena vulgaris]|nr:hypothetical protein DFH09DRAFT_1076796 [Mycena vulgaris]
MFYGHFQHASPAKISVRALGNEAHYSTLSYLEVLLTPTAQSQPSNAIPSARIKHLAGITSASRQDQSVFRPLPDGDPHPSPAKIPATALDKYLSSKSEKYLASLTYSRTSNVVIRTSRSQPVLSWERMERRVDTCSTVNCGVYVIWFAKQLASGHPDLSSWKFTSGDSDLERIRIANRLSAAIHADVPERNVRQMHALGISLPANVKEKDPLGREEYTLHLLMVEAMHPRLASTNITRLPSLETWSAAQHQRRTVPEVGSCVLFPFAADPTSDTMAYPALVTHIDDSNLEYLRVALEWFPGIYGGVPEGTGLLDSVSLEALFLMEDSPFWRK